MTVVADLQRANRRPGGDNGIGIAVPPGLTTRPAVPSKGAAVCASY
jgi:hypothetical protein